MRAIDRLTLNEQGLVTARWSFLDPVPLALAVAARPAAWAAWWRSGLWPLPGGDVIDRRASSLATGLGVTRLLLGLMSGVAPQTARRTVGFSSVSGGDHGLFVRLFAARDAVLGAATLSSDRRTSEIGLRMGALCDLADVAAGLLAGRFRVALAAAGFGSRSPCRHPSGSPEDRSAVQSRLVISRPVRSGAMAENAMPASGPMMPSASAIGTAPAMANANSG